MVKKFLSKITTGMVGGAVITLIVIASAYAISWIITCGLIKLICMCFGLTFTWAMATGIWLIIIILKSIFSSASTSK